MTKRNPTGVMRHVTEWLRRLRVNDNFEPTFNTLNSNETNTKNNTSVALSNVLPRSAITSTTKPQH